jgi:PAS domain S-box-containing protein
MINGVSEPPDTILAEPGTIFLPLILIFGLTAVGCFAGALYGSQLQGRDTRLGFRAVLVTTGLWLSFQVLGLMTFDEGLSTALYIGGLICGITGVGAWVYFVSAYTGRSYHRDRRYRGLAVGAYLGLVVIKLTNPLYGLYILTRFESEPYPHLVVEPQLFYLLSFAITYLLVAVSFYWLLDTFRDSSYPTTALGALVVLSLLPVVPRLAVVLLPASELPPILFGLSFEPIGVAAFTLGILVFVEDTFRRIQKPAQSKLFDEADDATFVYHSDGRLISSNSQADALQSELSIECPTAEKFEQLFSDANQRDGSGPVSFENGGSTRYFDATITPMKIGSETVGRVAQVRDVTERRERKRDLKIKERAMDEAKVGITISDPDTEDNPLVYVNDGFVEQTGYGRKEALGRNCRFLQADDRDQSALDDLRDAIAAEEPITVELRNHRKDGEQFWNRLSVTPVYDDDGELVNYIGIQQDVTEQKEKTRLLEVLFNGTFQFIGLLETDGTVVRVNDTALEFGGFDRQDIVGEPFYEASWWTHSEEAKNRLREALDRGADGEFVRYNTEVNGKDGFAMIDFSVKPVTDDCGDVVLLVVEGRDITDREEKRKRMGMVQRVMRHNIRNDLTKVRGWAQIMSEEPDADTRLDHLSQIEDTLDEWEKITQDMERLRDIETSTEKDGRVIKAHSAIRSAISRCRNEYPSVEITQTSINSENVWISGIVEEAVKKLIMTMIDQPSGEESQLNLSLSKPNEGWVAIEVVDTGNRMNQQEGEILSTGEETALVHAQGTGIWVIRTLIKEAGGNISVQVTDTETKVAFRVPTKRPT